MKLTTFQCPVCMSTHYRKEGDVFVCEACGNSYTQRQADSQMFIDLRIANRHRQFAEFAKARDIYLDIIAKYPDEDLSAAYWGLLLCDQSVMLEMDNSGQIFPSFYRVKSLPIEESQDYKNFMDYVEENAPEKLDDYQSRINIIENARDKANVIAKTTKPYDVFLCFKKTQLDSDMVTPDYDVANEIYNELSSKYKIFYSEKSLRNIRVRDFEPNIYYGLYTAKVMLIICSKKEFLESHWMKNEWKRFLDLNKNRDLDYKSIIPIFIDNFKEEDLPDELAHKQALKYGISLIADIDKTLQKIVNPIDRDEVQQKQIDMLMENQRRLIEEWSKRQSSAIEYQSSGDMTKVMTPQEQKIVSILKLARVNIEDLNNFAEAEEQVRKAQEIDAENYITWYYKLLIDFKAQSLQELVMHDNYKESVNYRLFVKYATKAGRLEDIQKLDNAREELLRTMAQKVIDAVEKLDNNPLPTDEDIAKLKLMYESLPQDAQAFVENIRVVVPNARKKMRDNRISSFQARVTMVGNKEHPNIDDILKIKEEYGKLSEDEQDLAGEGYKQVIDDASNKMKQAKTQKIQQALINLDNQTIPSRDDLIHVEKMYNDLDDALKPQVKDFKEIMMRAYDRKYDNDANTLSKYLTKLPSEKVPNRDIYTKLENRYKALPKKYRIKIQNIQLLDDYYDRLVALEGGTVQKAPEKPQTNNEIKGDQSAKKKKHWLW